MPFFPRPASFAFDCSNIFPLKIIIFIPLPPRPASLAPDHPTFFGMLTWSSSCSPFSVIVDNISRARSTRSSPPALSIYVTHHWVLLFLLIIPWGDITYFLLARSSTLSFKYGYYERPFLLSPIGAHLSFFIFIFFLPRGWFSVPRSGLRRDWHDQCRGISMICLPVTPRVVFDPPDMTTTYLTPIILAHGRPWSFFLQGACGFQSCTNYYVSPAYLFCFPFAPHVEVGCGHFQILFR